MNLKTVKKQIDEIINHNPPSNIRFGEYRRMTRAELLQMQNTSSIAHIVVPVGEFDFN